MGQRLILSLEPEHECTIEIRAPRMKSYGQLSVRREPRVLPQVVTFHINARTSNDVQKVQSEIQTIIKDNYAEVEEYNSYLEFVDDEDVAQIIRQQTDMAIVDVGK